MVVRQFYNLQSDFPDKSSTHLALYIVITIRPLFSIIRRINNSCNKYQALWFSITVLSLSSCKSYNTCMR